MTDDDPERTNFEDVARGIADEVARALERFSDIDKDEIARTVSAEAERARQWLDEIGGWLRDQTGAMAGEAPAPASAPWDAPRRDDDPLGNAGPHPLDLPTADQGLALAALDSGRWRLEPGTSALALHGEGVAPRDALGLVRELRVRDWLSADGELTLAGHNALRRWLEASERA